jgi:L-arabinose isomerase
MENLPKVGLFGVGLNTYWPQFEGLYERLIGYQNEIAERIRSNGGEVVNAGMVDCHEKSVEAADLMRKEGVEIVFLYISTYALSSTVLPVVQRLRVPVIILNVQPVAAIDYAKLNALGDRGKMTGEVSTLSGLLRTRICIGIQPCRHLLRNNIGLSAGRLRVAGSAGMD